MATVALSSLLEYFEKFIETHRLIDPSKQIIIGISGGADSVFLAFLMNELKDHKDLPAISWLYCDHGTRKEEIESEINFLKELSQKWKTELIIEKLDCDFKSSNFELEARFKRYEAYSKWAKRKNAHVFLGHHIDDSFEWSLMQQFKSSNPNSTLGIPVKNSIYRRPLMCLSKKQILNFSQDFKVQFLEDSSNRNPRFERNYLRKNVIENIKKRFPGYLKNYVERSNRMALEMGVHSLGKNKVDSFLVTHPMPGVVTIEHAHFKNDFSHAKEQIYQSIHQLSSSKRGSLRKQVNNLIEAAKNGKQGPLSFSGQVKALLIPGVIFLYGSQGEESLLRADQHASEIVGKVSRDHLDSELKSRINKGAFSPVRFLYFHSSEQKWPKNKQFKPLRKAHPLLPLTSQALINKGILWQWTTKYFALGLNK